MVCVWPTFRILLLFRSYISVQHIFKDCLRFDCQVFFKIFCYLWLFTILSHSILGVLFKSIDWLICRRLLRFSFNRLLRKYFAHFQNYLLFDCYVIVLRILGYSKGLRSKFTLVSHSVLGLPYTRLFCQFLAHFQDSLSIDCYVDISGALRIFCHLTVTLVSGTVRAFHFSISLD